MARRHPRFKFAARIVGMAEDGVSVSEIAVQLNGALSHPVSPGRPLPVIASTNASD